MKVTEEEIERAKGKDIIEFLSIHGINIVQKGRTSVCSSPFSSDSTPSFVVYTDQNRFHDFSTGAYGDTIELASRLLSIPFQESVRVLNGEEMPVWEETEYEEKPKGKKPFNIDNYTTLASSEVELITAYAKSRGLIDNYRCGFFYQEVKQEWVKRLAVVFPHEDENRNITGAKFRNIGDGDRFTARGKLGAYECSNILHEGYNVYIVEGEGNANSLCEYFKKENINGVAVSYGGVGSVPKELKYPDGNLFPYVIIDYDGNEQLYQERLKPYEHLDGINIKLTLPKGDDINSLWVKGQSHLFSELL